MCRSFYLCGITVVCVCVCVRSSRQFLASDRGGVLFVTRTGLSPPPGVGITMIVMAMECEWQAGSHVVAGEQEARTAPVPDISLSFIKTLHSFRTTHSLCCKISPIYFPFFSPSVSLMSWSLVLSFISISPALCLSFTFRLILLYLPLRLSLSQLLHSFSHCRLTVPSAGYVLSFLGDIMLLSR